MSMDQAVAPAVRISIASRISDFVELTKARIAVMVLATVAAGYFLGAAGRVDGAVLLAALVGTALVAAGSSVVNQIHERDIDGRMHRTSNRPLPAGRISVLEAWSFAGLLTFSGLSLLIVEVNALTAALAALSFVLYAWVYTPLKQRTVLNTAIGAIPGALPTVIGWTAAGNGLSANAWLLFAILYLWQFPHFYAIAWIYREDYARGGLRMLPTSELGQRTVGLQSVSYCLALLPASLLPAAFSSVGTTYLAVAMLMGLYYLGFAIAFSLRPRDKAARSLMVASLVYLPMVLGALMIDVARG